MNYQLYAIYDKVAEQYGSPFVSLNDAVAVRSFNAECKRNMLAEPTDFELYCIGLYDTSLGSITPNTPIRFVAKGQVIACE